MNIKGLMQLVAVSQTTQIFQWSSWIKRFYDIQNELIGPNVFRACFI